MLVDAKKLRLVAVYLLTAICFLLLQPRVLWHEPCPHVLPRLRSKPGPIVALASFPGSGNTWVRHLLQEATGLSTGSVYWSKALRSQGFPGEGVASGRVVAVKTHIWKGPKAFKISHIRPVQGGGMRRSYSSRNYDRAVLLVRRPEECLLAEYNRRNTGNHTGRVNDNMLQNQDWLEFLMEYGNRWEMMNSRYITEFPGKLLVVDYSRLKSNLLPELRRILDFLGEPVARERLACVEKHREGAHHRAAGGSGQVLSPAVKKDLEDRWKRVQNLFTNRH